MLCVKRRLFIHEDMDIAVPPNFKEMERKRTESDTLEGNMSIHRPWHTLLNGFYYILAKIGQINLQHVIVSSYLVQKPGV